jgi:hypothetical protein
MPVYCMIPHHSFICLVAAAVAQQGFIRTITMFYSVPISHKYDVLVLMPKPPKNVVFIKSWNLVIILFYRKYFKALDFTISEEEFAITEVLVPVPADTFFCDPKKAKVFSTQNVSNLTFFLFAKILDQNVCFKTYLRIFMPTCHLIGKLQVF